MKVFCPVLSREFCPEQTGTGQNGTKPPMGGFLSAILSRSPTFGVFDFVRFCPEFCPVGNLACVCPPHTLYSVTTCRGFG